MSRTADAQIEVMAESCVDAMGDIFWDYDADRDQEGDYTDPYAVALTAVKEAMSGLVALVDTNPAYPASLREEYQSLVNALPESAADTALIAALTAQAEWTQEGAAELVRLARRQGCFMLRNALALAEAMGIEDGNDGF